MPGYKLKLNSYDLGVDIELADALNRIRFEHPEVKSVVLTSGKSRMFCSGANIYMLGHSSHAWKVNFCKFTNETRNGIEDSSRHSGLKFLAALNGTTAGGGYELALACDEIAMVDDRSSTVSLPEVPLLGVLPGTGGLTRLVDKRKVRRDLADVFCTTAEGVRADRAKEWRLVDHIAKPQQFAEMVKARALELAQAVRPARRRRACALTPLGARTGIIARRGRSTDDAHRDAHRRTGPRRRSKHRDERRLVSAAPRARARRAILDLRTNQLDVGTVGAEDRRAIVEAVLELRRACSKRAATTGSCARRSASCAARFSRLDVSSRSHVRDHRAGLVLRRHAARARARRRPQLHARRRTRARRSRSRALNFGAYPMANGLSRLATRFCGERRPSLPRDESLDAEARARARPRHLDARRHRLGRRGAPRDRGARQPVARRAHRHGGEPALRRPGDHADARLRPPLRLAELDLHPARTRSASRARSRCTAPARRPNSTGNASRQSGRPMSATIMSTSTTPRRFRTTSTWPTTARCSARSSTGSRTSSTGGTRWGRATSRRPTSTCAPRPRSTRRAGRTTAR